MCVCGVCVYDVTFSFVCEYVCGVCVSVCMMLRSLFV